MAETILVIDDDPAMLDFLTQRLAPEGFTISTAASSKDGINQAFIYRPNLILLDLRMPVQDGVTVCKVLRANPKTQHIPIIVITGVLLPSQLEEARTSGADDFTFKPIDLVDLLIRIRAMLACRAIDDPMERFTRYYEITREAANKSSRLHPPDSKE
ncbi:MAG: response regulator [Verrucomicrobiia bacterium]|jgi:two-component system cell cycle response regulator